MCESKILSVSRIRIHPSSQMTEQFVCKCHYMSLALEFSVVLPSVDTLRFFPYRISKSENNPSDQPKAQSGPVQQISMYCVSELVCEDSEYSFEELRALRYWGKCKQQAELQEIGKYFLKQPLLIHH